MFLNPNVLIWLGRREFFRVTLEDIQKVVEEDRGEIEFIKTPEAKEYRETLTVLQSNEEEHKPPVENKFPESLL